MDPILLLKIGGEGGFVEIYQEGEDYVYHSDESTLKEFLPEEEGDDMDFEKRESFPSLDEALSRVNLHFLKHGVITYINPDNEFDIKLKIHERIRHL